MSVTIDKASRRSLASPCRTTVTYRRRARSESLDAGDPVVRAVAAKVLGRLGARGAVPRLIEVAELDPSDVVQSYAVEALRKLNHVRARPILEHIVATHDQVSLRRGAALALEGVGN